MSFPDRLGTLKLFLVKTPHILIIDDDPVSQLIAKKFIRVVIPDARIHSAANGQEAISHLTQENEELPSSLLLDLNMPLMNGYEFLSWHAESQFVNQYKIIIYTSSKDIYDKNKTSHFVDVVAFIEKPITVSRIGELIACFRP